MPYTEEEIKAIQKAIEEAEALIPEIEMRIRDRQRIGEDVAKEIEELNKLKEKIRLMKEVYGEYFR